MPTLASSSAPWPPADRGRARARDRRPGACCSTVGGFDYVSSKRSASARTRSRSRRWRRHGRGAGARHGRRRSGDQSRDHGDRRHLRDQQGRPARRRQTEREIEACWSFGDMAHSARRSSGRLRSMARVSTNLLDDARTQPASRNSGLATARCQIDDRSSRHRGPSPRRSTAVLPRRSLGSP